MSYLTLEDFLHDFRQNILAGAEANEDFLEAEFAQNVANELIDAGAVEGFETCHYKAPVGMRVDGYYFNEDDADLSLFIVDFANREEIASLTRTDVQAIFNRVEKFFKESADKKLFDSLEETSPGYGLSRQIAETRQNFAKVNFFLLSERQLSERLQSLEDKVHEHWTFTYHIWDMSRLYRLKSSKGEREELEIDFVATTGRGLPCLPAHLETSTYESYLLVMPAKILADLYGQYGSRLLEQNVRSFLQARGNVNKGIRATILNDPEMFFAYNNGITATAKEVKTVNQGGGIFITDVIDLQIVNGGQTTASLFHTQRKDKASLDNIFVQVKLSVVDEEKSEEVVPRISEYANTQNKVNAADFFSNHPFHVRMEDFSRRLLAPAQAGAQRETRWFYERARGQYADAQSKLSPAEQKKFKIQHPKPQMFTKTDLAKFENVWDEKPRFVNLGAQKNFAQYASRIGKEWNKKQDKFNELYFKRAVARALIFRTTEKIISAQDWYNGGYRANAVAYTLAMLSLYCKNKGQSLDFQRIWDKQKLSEAMNIAIARVAEVVYSDITSPPPGISNVGEWCKKDGCWLRLQARLPEVERVLPEVFNDELVKAEVIADEEKTAVKVQKLDDSIEIQRIVMSIPAAEWKKIMDQGRQKRVWTEKEDGILQIAARIPDKIPTDKQCAVLHEVLQKAELEGIFPEVSGEVYRISAG